MWSWASGRFWLAVGIISLANPNLVQAQDQPLIESENPLLERLTKNERGIDWADMNIQFSSGFNTTFKDGKFEDAAFKIHRIRLEILGAFREKFSYHFRQSLNQYSNPNYPSDNLSGQVEVAQMGWQMTDKLKLTAGKQAVQFSGNEYWINAIQVRDYSDFGNTVPAYRTGANLNYRLSPHHELNFQVVNYRLGSLDEEFVYGLPDGVEKSKSSLLATVNWDANLFDKAWLFRYSVSCGQLAKNKNIFYFTCGNVFDKKPVYAYLDFLYSREGIDSRGFISECTAAGDSKPRTATNVSYFTTIANIDYRLNSHWNVYAKGTYELGNVYKSTDEFTSGNYRRSSSIQLCAEYFPMADSELLVYCHLVHKNVHLTQRARKWGGDGYNSQRFTIGIVYTLPVF